MQAPPSDRMGAFCTDFPKLPAAALLSALQVDNDCGTHSAAQGFPSLSLRGGRRATWRPEREARGSALGVQSREGSYVFAGAFLLSTPVLRDCRVASLLAMTIRGPVPFYRQPVPTVSSAPGGACPSPTTRDWKLRVTLRYPLSIFHLHHAAPTTTAPIRIGGGGHFLYICLTGARTSCSCGAGGGPAPP